MEYRCDEHDCPLEECEHIHEARYEAIMADDAALHRRESSCCQLDR